MFFDGFFQTPTIPDLSLNKDCGYPLHPTFMPSGSFLGTLLGRRSPDAAVCDYDGSTRASNSAAKTARRKRASSDHRAIPSRFTPCKRWRSCARFAGTGEGWRWDEAAPKHQRICGSPKRDRTRGSILQARICAFSVHRATGRSVRSPDACYLDTFDKVRLGCDSI